MDRAALRTGLVMCGDVEVACKALDTLLGGNEVNLAMAAGQMAERSGTDLAVEAYTGFLRRLIERLSV